MLRACLFSPELLAWFAAPTDELAHSFVQKLSPKLSRITPNGSLPTPERIMGGQEERGCYVSEKRCGVSVRRSGMAP
jgi:hypothetical protein